MPYPTQPWPVLLVRGEQQVYGYQMQPNTTSLFLSTEEDVFWLKTCDGMGTCTVRAFDYTEREGTEQGFATKSDVSSINEKLNQLLGELK